MIDIFFPHIIIFTLTSIPHLIKTHLYHDKNEYANANSLREHTSVIPHNGGIFYID